MLKGIQTWLTIFPSGIQMEHSSSKDLSAISALFYYPIRSLVYCGALRFINHFDSFEKEPKAWKFSPLDTEIAQHSDNLRNPPLFVIFLKGVDPNSKKQIIECHVFVVGMIKTSMRLIESCQKAFNISKETVSEFYKKYGNVPVVYCMKNDLSDKSSKRVVVKSFDLNGYFYATENTPIDVWQLFEENEIFYESTSNSKSVTNCGKCDLEQVYSSIAQTREDIVSNKKGDKKLIVDPYEKSDNLVKVEKRVDPVTGQNIYVRYLAEPNKNQQSSKNQPKTYDLPNLIYGNGDSDENDQDDDNEQQKDRPKQAPIIFRQEKTPSPIIVEKYIKKSTSSYH